MEQSVEFKEFIDTLTENYRVLPQFEKPMFDYRLKKHGSLKSNEYLACRWKEYKDNVEKIKHLPFHFPHNTDYHFYKYQNCYKPSESITNRSNYRYSLIPGPGVDKQGDIPIPQDVRVRSDIKSKRKPAMLRKINKIK